MKHGNVDMRGGGGKIVAFTRSTDGSGNPETASSTTHYGSPAGAITVTRTGTGVYRLAWDMADYGTNLAAVHVTVALGSGDWTTRVAITRASGYVDVTCVNGGSAANVVSGALVVTLVFGPQGY